MKTAIITSVYYPENSNQKFNIVSSVLDNIPKYAGVDYDLFIVNDGTKDPRFEEFMKNYKPREFCKSIDYYSRENRGITKSMNELLARIDSSYDYICLINLDILVPVYWLKKCISVLKHDKKVGLCGVLVEDHLEFDLKNGIGQTKDSVLFSHVVSIGGACMVFRADELKGYGWDEDVLTSNHIDSYMISRYRMDGRSSYAILERGYHSRELYESKEFIDAKFARHESELPNFYKALDKVKNK